MEAVERLEERGVGERFPGINEVVNLTRCSKCGIVTLISGNT